MAKNKVNNDWDNWSPEYGNQSRKGLLSGGEDGTGIDDLTINRQDYKWPKYPIGPHARKKKILRKFLYQEVAHRYFDELRGNEETFKMEDDTSYKTEFQGSGFQVVDLVDTADPEVMSKYPLYNDMGHSVYVDTIKNIKTSFVSHDPQSVFRRTSYFSKPFYAELE